jgi:hypothetical protein
MTKFPKLASPLPFGLLLEDGSCRQAKWRHKLDFSQGKETAVNMHESVGLEVLEQNSLSN